MDFNQVLAKAEEYKKDISDFLKDIIAIPSESCKEELVVKRIKSEMEKAGFDRVEIDGMGNILGFIGHGKHIIAMDAHIDTVGTGDKSQWKYDPYIGYEDEEIIIGRGASDQKGGMASMVYAGKIIKDLKLEDDYTLIVTGTVQEEDCDGLCWQYIINEDNITPEFVVITEPTSCNIYRGQRGRMEIKIQTKGISCHGSAPERGDNAIYKMAPILMELKELNERLKDDSFLGKGTLTVSEVFFSSPSRCAVADGCTISVDRRLTQGETWEYALEQIRNLPSVRNVGADVSMYEYSSPSYTDLVYKTQAYFPTWVLEENHPACQTLIKAYKALFVKEPLVDKWTFSTNAVSIMGRFKIPCIGFGPGHEDQAHAPNEMTWKRELVDAAAMYALIPIIYVKEYCKD
ncbi:YgeY family selenium metabolism-linked hydrolase [Clostridium polyendosporum]|uniref:YgeY family selenium metabolism-linked hydrolase n=1 Tax=Clostridium polyendosporum TaxID=69208 RepID=UPI0038994099